MDLNKATLRKIALLVGGGVVLAWLLNNFDFLGTLLSGIWALLFPFILGFVVAFLLNLPMRAIERVIFRGRGGRARRPVSFILTVLVVLAVIALVLVLLVPQLVQTVSTLVSSMPGYIQHWQAVLKPYEDYIPEVQQWLQNLNIDWQSLLAKLTDVLQSGALDFIDGAVGVATSIVSGATSFVIGLIFACYLLLDKEHLSAQLEALLMAYLPKARFDKLMDLAKLTYRSYAKFVSGQLIEALIVTVIYIVVLHIGQFDYALLISVLIGFFSLIPMIGIIIGCAIGALLLLVSMGFWRAVIFLGVCFVVQQFEGNIIYPRVVGTSVGLPPVWVLVAVTVGGGLAGIPGMLFFIPLFSVLYTLLHRDARRRLAKKGIASPVGALPQRVPRSARKPRRRFSRRRGRPDDHDDS